MDVGCTMPLFILDYLRLQSIQQIGEQAIKLKLETASLRCVDFNVLKVLEKNSKSLSIVVYCFLLVKYLVLAFK